MIKLIKYVFLDILRSKVVIGYTLFLLLVSFSLFSLDANPVKASLGLMNIVLLVLPLVSIVFSTIHFYNSHEFIELLVSQPVRRKGILLSQFAGVSISLVLAFIVGAGIPVLIYCFNITGLTLIIAGILLTLVFSAIAFLASVITNDKATGIGIAILLWFFFSLIYDGLILLILFSFSDYPIEKLMMTLTMINPVDLSRIFVLLQLDVSALMGYSEALFRDFFGTGAGMFISFFVMMLWIILPLFFAVKVFNKKDL